jgi:hypothetical protein
MKNVWFCIVPITVAVLLCGCEQAVDFGRTAPSAGIVINAIFSAQADTHQIKISESVFAFSGQTPSLIEEPEIQLRINGELCQEVRPDTVIDNLHAYYTFISPLKAGDKVEVTANTAKHATVSGFDCVPAPAAEITGIEHAWFRKEARSYLRLHVTLRDNLLEKNFYRIVIKTKTDIVPPSIQEPTDYWVTEEVFVDEELLFHNPTDKEEAGHTPNFYRIFSDELFQGKEYTLNVYIRHDRFDGALSEGGSDYVRSYVKAEIHTLSEKLYRGLNSRELASGTIGDAFVEPVKVYSNMQGGYGLFGIYSVSEKEKLVASIGEE